uniref:Transposase n=1 Tax=Caenorhabditis tropicalis TaxID=1561998 RepID=A0A1I7SXN4_9PELO
MTQKTITFQTSGVHFSPVSSLYQNGDKLLLESVLCKLLDHFLSVQLDLKLPQPFFCVKEHFPQYSLGWCQSSSSQ